jgi:C-terminal processing protease CtpA/Prc
MNKWIAVTVLSFAQNSVAADDRSVSAPQLRADFAEAAQLIAENYAYFDKKEVDWSKAISSYADTVTEMTTRAQLVSALEQLIDELYDPHAQLNTNSPQSWRLVPSGTDLWAEWTDGNAIITEVRAGSDAARAGIRAGDAVLTTAEQSIQQAVEARMGRTYPHSSIPARDWALRSVLAGRHDTERVLTVQSINGKRTVKLSAHDQFARRADQPVSHSIKAANVGYIRIEDSLGALDTIRAFDAALDSLMETRALIVDLRNTASGGNSSVARGMLSRFVRTQVPYQKHDLPAEERDTGINRSWYELVAPRGRTYLRPVVVLVDHWTGSMGEGIAIGFDATRTGIVMGTAMAGLLGATYHLELSHTHIGLNIPAERLYHIDGTPREAFVPRIVIDPRQAEVTQDAFIDAALRQLKEASATNGHR